MTPPSHPSHSAHEDCLTCPAAFESSRCAACAARLFGPGPLIVRHHGYGVQFHTNVCGRCFSLVRELDATPFLTVADARAAARAHGLRTDEQTTIEALELWLN